MISPCERLVSIEDLIIGARFIQRLPSFLRHPIDHADDRAIVRQRLERREADFLALVRRAIYAHVGSPYRELLRLAGCECGDLERIVGQVGVEGALHILYRRGVYLILDEFKGRRPVVRGGLTISVDPSQLRNPLDLSRPGPNQREPAWGDLSRHRSRLRPRLRRQHLPDDRGSRRPLDLVPPSDGPADPPECLVG